MNQEDKIKNHCSIIRKNFDEYKDTILTKYHLNVPYNLDFIEDSGHFLANCDFANNTINVNKSALYERGIQYTLLHELAHAICDMYKICQIKDTGWHSLEFAIINYVLEANLVKHYDVYGPDNRTYFRSYDISEDVAYDKIFINPKRFDDKIKSIKFNSITELVDIAVTWAMEIRRKCRN